LFAVRWGGVRDDSIASGITHVADNEFNAYLLCEFLLKSSTIAPDVSFHIEDEGKFIIPGTVMFRNGEIYVGREDLQAAGTDISLDTPQIFSVVNPNKYDEHPRFSQTIDDFEEMDDDAVTESVSRYGVLGFSQNYETAWGDSEGLNLQQRARKIIVV